MPGNGRELAEHLILRFGLSTVVEEGGVDVNHYDPGADAVRLSPEVYAGRSLTAVAIAAHEVGHAIQYHREERLIRWRTKMLPRLRILEALAGASILLIPVVGGIVRIPHVMIFMGLMVGLIMLSRIAFHLSTLPVEWDASFGKAMPILVEGNYVPEPYVPAIRQVLKAAAFTYVAGALADLLSIWRWIRFLR